MDLATFVELGDDPAEIEKKKLFEEKFGIIKKEDKEEFYQELVKFNGRNMRFYMKDKKNSLHIWDHIEEDGFHHISKIARIAQTLPTSSATIEQSFSIMKLIKSDKRNQLTDRTLEALLLIRQNYKDSFSEAKNSRLPLVEEEIIERFFNVKHEINQKKKVIKKKKDVEGKFLYLKLGLIMYRGIQGNGRFSTDSASSRRK